MKIVSSNEMNLNAFISDMAEFVRRLLELREPSVIPKSCGELSNKEVFVYMLWRTSILGYVINVNRLTAKGSEKISVVICVTRM